MSEAPANARNAFGAFSPKLAELTDDVLFGGDVWGDPRFPRATGALVTITILLATYRPNELPTHLRRAMANGVTRDEIVALLTHIAFYAGWPAAMSGLQIVKKVFAETEA